MSLLSIIIGLYVWTVLVLVSDEVTGSKELPLGQKLLYVTVLFVIIAWGGWFVQ